MSLRLTYAECWTVPAPWNDGPPMIVIKDERGTVTLDDTVQGWHPITNPELMRLTMFKIELEKHEARNR